MPDKTPTEKPQRTDHQFTDEELTAIANKVAKSFKAKQYKALAEHISKKLTARHYWIIGKSLGKSPLFWIVVILAIGSICLTAWKAVPHFVKQKAQQVWNDEITNNIKSQFQEPRISNIVVAVASAQASNTMLTQITPEIDKFETNLTAKTQSIQSNLDNVLTDLYSRLHMQDETIYVADTSKFTRVPTSDGGALILLKLGNVAIPSSVHLTMRAPKSMTQFVPMDNVGSTFNVAYFSLSSGNLWLLDSATFMLQYAASSDKGKFVNKIEFLNGQILFDGKPWKPGD